MVERHENRSTAQLEISFALVAMNHDTTVNGLAPFVGIDHPDSALCKTTHAGLLACVGSLDYERFVLRSPSPGTQVTSGLVIMGIWEVEPNERVSKLEECLTSSTASMTGAASARTGAATRARGRIDLKKYMVGLVRKLPTYGRNLVNH